MTENMELMKEAEQEANALLEVALNLSCAKNGGNDSELVAALDENLKLWVGIETSLKNAKNFLPADIKGNLLKLSKFVERLTISKGLNLTDDDVSCLINVNMQICKGLLESVHNNLAKEEAFSLLKCAIDLSNASENKNVSDLVEALDNNMKLWVYIRTLANQKENILTQEICSNLTKLADYVSAKTIEIGRDIEHFDTKVINSMVMANLQISEGLLSKKAA